tara:strand:+ start:167 stop:553 length:387 start_codon:yes stop_codon:yes gene_type:complete
LVELKTKIKQLENKNKKLSDSLNNIEKMNLANSMIIGVPNEVNSKVNEESEIKFGLFRVGKFRKSNIYLADKEFNKKELLEENYDQALYNYSYTPKSITDNRVRLIFEYKFEDETYELQGNISLNVVE